MSNNSRLSKEEIAKIRESYETASENTVPVMDRAQQARAARYQPDIDKPLNFDK